MGEAEAADGGEAALTMIMTEMAPGWPCVLSVKTASPVNRGLGCSGRRSGDCCGRQVRRERGRRQLPNRPFGRGRRRLHRMRGGGGWSSAGEPSSSRARATAPSLAVKRGGGGGGFIGGSAARDFRRSFYR